MELTKGQQRALALAAARKRQAEADANAPKHPEFDGSNVPGYNPETGMVEPEYGMAESAAMGAADTVTFGFGDELASYLGSWLEGVPREQVLSEMRRNAQAAQEQNPGSYMAGQVAGGVAQGVAAGPASLSARFAGSALLPRMLAGGADGLILGGAYGAGSGTDAQSRIVEALKMGGMGLLMGTAFPAVAAGAGKAYEGIRNALLGRPIAQQAGTTPETLRALGGVLDADGSLGPQGQANMARAGQEAMLVDAGPTARRALDTAIQRSGPGAVVARDAVSERVARDSQRLTQALDDVLGAPQGVTATRSAIRNSTAGARSNAYDDAYRMAIDYADPRGQTIERLVKSRVPPSAIKAANDLMRAEGVESAQILAKVADDGSVVFERLPDVRQLDYITRGLNEVADAANAQGQLGGTTALGRAYGNLSREIRDTLKELVPEYGKALETAADPIRRSKAVELGSRLLSRSMTRDQVIEAVGGMTQAERSALAQGVRSQIDDAMANVTRSVQDGDMPAREAIKALRDLSSRANREKLSAALGDQQASRLFDEIDRIIPTFELRASVADNSATYARLAMDRRVKDMTGAGPVGTIARGEPLNATKRIIQAITGQTDEALRGREDAVYADMARLLTQRGGPGQQVYDAINRLGQTDQATQLMRDRIVRALSGPQISYPLAIPAAEALPFR